MRKLVPLDPRTEMGLSAGSNRIQATSPIRSGSDTGLVSCVFDESVESRRAARVKSPHPHRPPALSRAGGRRKLGQLQIGLFC